MPETRGFGLYVHWPFCQAKCPYCDFNSHVANTVDQARWAKALVAEIHRMGELTGGRVLDTIFFGGGTPSLMLPETVESVITAAKSVWLSSNDIEITLEANPTSVEAARFRGYTDAGVNRISIGVQSLNDADLRALGRLHTADEARRAVDTAREIFRRVSFDLIYARQDQSFEGWRRELLEALSMMPDHLSLYQLTIEDGTAFGERAARGTLRGLPDEDLSADMYQLTQELTEENGLPGYEISNHARPGQESRHNLIYWRSGDWAGVGPGAHGRLTLSDGRMASEAHKAPANWLASVEQHGNGDCLVETIPSTQVTEERLIMGLRLREGVPRYLIPDNLNNKINEWVDMGLLEADDDSVRATHDGRPLLNSVLRHLLT